MTSSYGDKNYVNTNRYDIPGPTPAVPGSSIDFGESKNGTGPSGIQLWNRDDGGAPCEDLDLDKIRQVKYYPSILNDFCFDVVIRGSCVVTGPTSLVSGVTLPSVNSIIVDGRSYNPTPIFTIGGVLEVLATPGVGAGTLARQYADAGTF